MGRVTALDPLIQNLKSTTFCGRRLTRRQIADIQEVVRTFPKLSRNELGQTVCEHLRWQTPSGSNRIQLAMRLLEELERLSILTLPPRQRPGRGRQEPLVPGPRSAPRPAIEGPLAALTPLRLEVASGAEAVAEWNEFVTRYHPLGYRQPIGQHLRYFLRDRDGRSLGCLLFDFAAVQLGCRDRWIGWQGQAHRKYLHLVVRNARYLLFPWVSVQHLASHALGLAVRQLPDDWQRAHGSRPVLCETYVDPRLHRGTCYRAAGWQCLGLTTGARATASQPARTPKQVWVRPLRQDFRSILLNGPPQRTRQRREPASADASFVQLWQGLIGTLTRVASAYDREWVRRQRTLNTLLVGLFVYRIVFTPDSRGYATVLEELWAQCRALDLALSERPVTPAAICRARAKVSEEVFLRIHRAVLAKCPPDPPHSLWLGHRTFAVDGSKLNLPRPLVKSGYRTPAPTAYYPQGLLSCLDRLHTRLPIDFGLHAHADERRAARLHLDALAPGDVVVYDRGYYSFALLHAHAERGLHAVFRLQGNANTAFDAFIQSERHEALVTLAPTADARRPQPAADWRPLRVRLVKYTVGQTVFSLATTLLDAALYRGPDLARLYHGRWSLEESYKSSKTMLVVEQFRGRSERLVRQELYAHFTLAALSRLFANHSEEAFREGPDGHGRPAVLANFRHTLHTVGRHLEGLFLKRAKAVGDALQRILDGIGASRQRRRPGRSYPRRSRKPETKWRNRKAAGTASPATA